MDFSNTRYYEILGVAHDASSENIEKAYRRELRERITGQSDVFEAYRVLSNKEMRAEYDKYLEKNGVFVTSARTFSEYSQESRDIDTNLLDSKESVEVQEAELDSEEPVEEKKDELDSEEPVEEKKDELDSEELVEEKKDELDSEELVEEKKDELDREKVRREYKPFTEYASVVESRSKKDLKNFNRNEKFKEFLKGLGIFSFTGPIGLAIWLNYKKKSIKLQKDPTPKRISKMTSKEFEAYQEYTNNLNDQINQLLSEPHNNYRLQITKIKYENFISFLEKRIDLCFGKRPTTKSEIFKNKVELASLRKQLEKAREKIVDIDAKIAEYSKSEVLGKNNVGLSRIYRRIESDDARIDEITEEFEKMPDGLDKRRKQEKVVKLMVHKNKLFEKRDKKGTKIKLRAMKKANNFVLAKGFDHSQILKGFSYDSEFNESYLESQAHTGRTR